MVEKPQITDATFEVVGEPKPTPLPPLDWRWKFFWVRIGLALFGILAFALLSSPDQPKSRPDAPSGSATRAPPGEGR